MLKDNLMNADNSTLEILNHRKADEMCMAYVILYSGTYEVS